MPPLHGDGHWFESDIAHMEIKMNTYYFYVTIIALAIYIVWQDTNVPKYLELRIKLAQVNLRAFFMKIKLKRQLDRDYKNIQKDMRERMKENGKDQM